MGRVIILTGSKGDLPHAQKISALLEELGVKSTMRIASAHKTPERLLEIIKEGEEVVFVTVAGRSNALSGLVDAQTHFPVIASPPYSERFSGWDILSSLRMPSGVAPMVVLEPEGAALAAAKIIALKDEGVRERVIRYQQRKREELIEADQEVSLG